MPATHPGTRVAAHRCRQPAGARSGLRRPPSPRDSRSLDVTLTAAADAAIDAQARLLLAWNQHINLTAIRTPEGVARLHVLDSLSAVPVLRDRVPRGPRDHGPGQRRRLSRAAARRGTARGTADARGLGGQEDALPGGRRQRQPRKRSRVSSPPTGSPIEVIAARAEQLAADDHRESWDVVTVRAVGTLAEVAELGLPLLRRGGLLVCWKREAAPPDAEGIGAAGPGPRAPGRRCRC